MNILDIAATEKSPRVLLDSEKRYFEIEGNSRPEDVREFYMPVVEKLIDFLSKSSDNKSNPIDFHFKFGYFNSSSAKFISDILIELSEYKQQGYNINLHWHYEDGDDDMYEAGTDFSQMIGVDFNYITF